LQETFPLQVLQLHFSGGAGPPFPFGFGVSLTSLGFLGGVFFSFLFRLIRLGGFLRVGRGTFGVLTGTLSGIQLDWSEGRRGGGEGVARIGSEVGGGVADDI
jgi:hypothetical protein